jgi:hypothetical protein
MRRHTYPIIYIALFMVIGCAKPFTTEYFLPENYRGEVAVIYKSDGDTRIQRQDRLLKIEIPDSGIAVINEDIQFGSVIHKYYCRNNDGSIDTINNFSHTDKQRYPVNIFFHRVMSFNPRVTPPDEENYYVEFFYVGESLDGTEKSRFRFEERVKNIVYHLPK